jgi:hypothetical protein
MPIENTPTTDSIRRHLPHAAPPDEAGAGAVVDRRASLKTVRPMLAADSPSVGRANRVNRAHRWRSELPQEQHDSVNGKGNCDEDEGRDWVNAGNKARKG